MKMLVSLSVILLFFSASNVFADGGAGGSGDAKPVPDHINYLVKSEKFAAASKKLKYFVRRESGSAEGWRLLALSQLKTGALKKSLKSHKKALALDNNNLKLNRSLGELYLAMNDQTKANAQLDKLKRLCEDCEHTLSLASDIRNYQNS